MKPKEQSLLAEAIIDALADFDPESEMADLILEDVKADWRNIRENRAEADWIDRQRFDTALARKLKSLSDMDEARALK